jgi:hypothetical protein
VKTVAILGAGPAGLTAAWTAGFWRGLPVSIHSKKQKSRISGAQYLHSPVPGISMNEEKISLTNRLVGSAIGYRQKVYGDVQGIRASAEGVTSGELVDAWLLQPAYDRMWRADENSINETEINGQWLFDHFREFDQIISSVPLPSICVDPTHIFHSQTIWIDPDPKFDIPLNEVIYNGEEYPSWYRASNINGVKSVEWSSNGPKPPTEGLIEIKKPISTNCSCWPSILRVGRYGQWKKGVLVHHTVNEVAWKFR